MIIKIAYSKGIGDTIEEQLRTALTNNFEESSVNFTIISYDEGHYKEKKDSYQLKASCGSRLLPFCAIYNDDKDIIKAFYSEVGECTVSNILEYIENEIL